MPIKLKAISRHAIPRALEKAERYRLLNEPVGAESICLDILAVEADNQQALVTLLLALTDQFGQGYEMSEVRPQDLLEKLTDKYERAYYAGIIAERQAQAILHQRAPHAAHRAHDLLAEAMRHFDLAATIRPPDNDDALLRWNTCARMMDSRAVEARAQEGQELPLE